MGSWLRSGTDWLLGVAVPLSFGAPGFKFRKRGFPREDTDRDLRGHVVVVTGANAGIGLAASRGLAERGATVIMVGRNEERLELAAQELRTTTTGVLETEVADLSLLQSTRELAGRLAARDRLDVLVNNAGVMLAERTLTREGLETAFATNVLSGFLLTHALADKLAASGGRVVNVTSGGMYLANLDLQQLEGQHGAYDGTEAYAQHKRAQVVLTELWAARLADAGVRVDAMHPGWAETPGVARSLPRFNRLLGPILRTPEQGADTIVFLAAARDLPGPSGSLFFDRAVRRKTLASSRFEAPELAQALWMRCAALTGTSA